MQPSMTILTQKDAICPSLQMIKSNLASFTKFYMIFAIEC